MANPLGEQAPVTPVEGGCGDPLCVKRAWFVIEVGPDDPAVVGPCVLCASALISVLSAQQVAWLQPGRRLCKRGLHDLDDPANLGHRGDYSQTFCLPCRRDYQARSDAKRRAVVKEQS